MKLRANEVLTVEHAKKLLGNEAFEMTDEEIQKMIDDFDIIAQHALDLVQESKKTNTQTD